ncbi:hypothetical protein N9R79_12405 [Vibrio sp.]|nr:hypothetical protein [Vibrio sp.]
MKEFAIGILVVLILWLFMDSGTDTVGKQQYAFDVMCALETDSEAMLIEARRMGKKLADNGIVMNDSEVETAINHWLRVYNVNSYEELTVNPEFMMVCKYNACMYEEKGMESCISEKVDTCFEYGLSRSQCIGR